MKNNRPNTILRIAKIRWTQKMAKQRKALPADNRHQTTQLPVVQQNRVREMDDLANHSVQTMEYNYYMDSYS